MAKVTIEDCKKRVPNRFELVLLAANRARSMALGEEPAVEQANHKNSVLALREIASTSVEIEKVRQNIIRGLQRHNFIESQAEEEDALDLSPLPQGKPIIKPKTSAAMEEEFEEE